MTSLIFSFESTENQWSIKDFRLYRQLTMDDTAKGGLTILGTFYRDSLRAQRFQTLITLTFEDHWV